MNWLNIPDSDSELHDLMHSTGRKLLYVIGGLYLVGHVIATLGFPEIFIPGIWGVSLYMLVLGGLTLLLMERKYFLAQVVWLCGLAGAIVLAFFIFRHVEIILLLIALPLMGVVTLGIPGAAITVLLVVAVSNIMIFVAKVPASYAGDIFLGGTAVAIFGWSLSSNLLGALEAASYHYSEARRLLDETQNHQAEISRLLKDREQVNYQLERMNEMLTFARIQAEEARENRNRFMLAVSHELRSPLNFIIGFSDLMVNAPDTYAPPDQWPHGLYDDVQEIYTSSKHLMRLINDILDMGKIDAGQMSLYREKAQMDQIVADVREMLAAAFEQKGIALVIELPSDLPPVFVDTTRIRQVLLNLLNNGLRFTDRGSVTLRIEKKESHLLASVTDTGMGISPEDLPRVFDEFRQVGEESWRRHTGTGLGLYISRHFVELHGGRMDVESTPGKGTRFYFTLPFESTAVEESLYVEPFRLLSKERTPLILLVTPHPEDAELLQRMCEGYTLFTITDIETAGENVRKLFPHAVLVAADAGRLLAESLPYNLPIVHFSLPRPLAGIGNLRAHLVKPVARQALLKTIQALGPHVRRLLIVDDDPAMIRFVKQAFRAGETDGQEGNYILMSAFSGAEGLDILQKNPVDAILLDLELPDVQGWEWLSRLQAYEQLARIPVIVVSARDVPQESFVSGTNALEVALHRPLTTTELGNVIRSVLENVAPQYPHEKNGVA